MATPLESPSVNSVRVQRAYRVNSVEKGRLGQRVHNLEREKVRSLRLVNQEIRMVSMTMEFIQSSSGQSGQGLAPDEAVAEEEKEDAPPCFMYGERTNSRRFGKNRRTQSAATRLRRGSTASSGSEGSEGFPRPASGPAHLRGTFMTSWQSDADSVFTDYDSDGGGGGRTGGGHSAHSRGGSRASSRTSSRASSPRTRSPTTRSRPTSRLDGVRGFSPTSYRAGRASRMPGHASGGETMRSADRSRAQARQWSNPAVIGLNKDFHKKVHDFKKDMNKDRAVQVGGRLNAFFTSMPAKRY